jgi:hypothetical protein
MRLALLAPLYICLVVIDERARWVALWIYLGSVLAGRLELRLADPGSALSRIGDGLLLLVMTVGLVIGGVTTIGSAAACAALLARVLVRLELARAHPVGFAIVNPAATDVGISVLTVASFALALAPRIAGVPKDVDTHSLGGFLLMACGGLALTSLAVELVRRGRSAVPRSNDASVILQGPPRPDYLPPSDRRIDHGH